MFCFVSAGHHHDHGGHGHDHDHDHDHAHHEHLDHFLHGHYNNVPY